MPRIVSASEQVERAVSGAVSYKTQARLRRLSHKGSQAGKHKLDGWRRQPADTQLLDFILRFEVTTIEQAARWFYGGSVTRARRRIGFMEHAGLIRKFRDFRHIGIVVLPTRAAATAVYGSHSPLADVRPPASSRIAHLLFVAEVAAQIMFDPDEPRQVISEREIRVYRERDTETIAELLRSRGVKLFPEHHRGSRPTTASVTRKRDAREVVVDEDFWLTVRVGGPRATYRIPDLIEIRDGDLWAVEVEVARKSEDRLKDILRGYRDCTQAHEPVAADDSRRLKELRPVWRQFRGVRWVCADDVAEWLTGPSMRSPKDITRPDTHGQPQVVIRRGERVYGVDPVTRKKAPGWIDQLWAESDHGRRMFSAIEDKSLTNYARPCVVEQLDMSSYPALEYMLAQETLPVRYHADFVEWERWRKLYKESVAGDDRTVDFTRWIRFEDNYRACIHMTRKS